MGLHLPEAPPPDSDEEDPEAAAALRSRASIPMDAGQSATCPLQAPVGLNVVRLGAGNNRHVASVNRNV